VLASEWRMARPYLSAVSTSCREAC